MVEYYPIYLHECGVASCTLDHRMLFCLENVELSLDKHVICVDGIADQFGGNWMR